MGIAPQCERVVYLGISLVVELKLGDVSSALDPRLGCEADGRGKCSQFAMRFGLYTLDDQRYVHRANAGRASVSNYTETVRPALPCFRQSWVIFCEVSL